MKKVILMILILALLALLLTACTGQVVRHTYVAQTPNTQYCCYGRTAIPYSIPDNVYQQEMAMLCMQYGGTVLSC